MRKIDKIENEKFYIEILTEWLLNRGYFHYETDNFFACCFMYDNFKLSYHKVRKIIMKKISKKILDNLDY